MHSLYTRTKMNLISWSLLKQCHFRLNILYLIFKYLSKNKVFLSYRSVFFHISIRFCEIFHPHVKMYIFGITSYTSKLLNSVFYVRIDLDVCNNIFINLLFSDVRISDVMFNSKISKDTKESNLIINDT